MKKLINIQKILTKRHLIQAVADRWKSQYAPFKDGPMPLFSVRNNLRKPLMPAEVYAALEALDKDTATEQQVTDIIGNDSWTRLVCDCCKNDVSAIMELGDAPDYESRTIYICQQCLKTAAQYEWPTTL